jgi:hemerythrin-like domain-containing protein
MIYELGRELQTSDFTDERATETMVAKLKQDLSSASSACLICLLHEHAGNEDQYVFPDVRTHEPEMVEKLLAEHREVVRRIADVRKIADELNALRNREERIEMGDKLNRAANDLFAFYLTHLNGEEATIVPAMWRHFTDEQLVAIRTNIERNTPPERYAEWMRWMFSSLNINELTGMFMGLKKAAPAPVFENMARIAEKALGEDRWAAVKAKAGL